MPRPKRASPATGRDGSNGPAPDDILDALAVEIIDQDQMKILRERRKAHRKLAEGKLVNLSHLDRLYKMRDDPPSEVEGFFRSMFTHMSAFFEDLTQLDLFTPKATREQKAAFGHHGLMAALKGEEATPPPNLTAEESNEWMEGHAKGAKARDNASHTLADTLADALKTADAGGVVDGTGGARRNPKAAKAGAEAKAAFEAEGTAHYAQPSWDGFSEKWGEWTAEQRSVFETWFALVPPKAEPEIDHVGVQMAFDVWRQRQAFEASSIELEGQKDRQVVKSTKPGNEAATDPLVVAGERYPNLKAAKAARAELSQSQKAAEKREAAGV